MYFRSADSGTLYVNLYIASTLDWDRLALSQQSEFPSGGTSTLTVERGGGPLDIRLRVPYWATEFEVTVNGVRQRTKAAPGSYVTLSRTWRPGDRIRVSAPYRLRIERAADDPTVQSLFYGPVLLVARSAERTLRGLSFYKDLTLSGDLGAAVRPEGRPLHFTAQGLTLAPFYLGDDSAYHAYFRRVEPTVVFGRADSGVPNRARADGLTFLDVLWSGAAFAGRTRFVQAVRTLADDWLGSGVLTRDERDRIVAAAGRAQLPA